MTLHQLPRATAAALSTLLWLAPAHAADLGETIALQGNGSGSIACATCHGVEGAGNAAAGFPRLAGMDETYLVQQLTQFRDGPRVSPVMAGGVKSLTDEQVAAVAAYYAGREAPAAEVAAPDAATSAVAEELMRHGDWRTRDLPACVSCHGPGAAGVGAAFPPLAGQHASYLAAQLRAFRDGARATDPGGLMGAVARQLTDGEIEAVSAWLAAQPVGGGR